jgi:DNA polymerase III alpha subunit
MHTEKVRKAISKKKISQFAKYKEQFIENGQKVLSVNKKFVSDLWDQIESFAEYGFNKSHSYAYTYVSARLLWLKAHYPIEFYTAVLMSEKETDKYKEYKLDAKKHDIKVKPVHINKSKENFTINGDDIYFGFENIKGIGHESAKRVVEPQPYKGFRDFMDRFGTDKKELQRIISLGCFDELEPDFDRVTLRKFHEFYKDILSKRTQRRQRFDKRMVGLDEKLREELLSEVEEDHPDFESLCRWDEDVEEVWATKFDGITREEQYKSKGETKTRTVPFTKALKKLRKDRLKSMSGFDEKERVDLDNPISMDNFNPFNIELTEEELEILGSKREIGDEVGYPMAESLYYGFQWIHKLDTSPDYSGLTIDKFLSEAEEGNLTDGSGVIEIVINAVRRRESKKVKKDGTRVEFWSIDIEDANARKMVINMWSDDHTRFRDYLKKGAMLRMEVRPPSGGFSTLTFKSYPRHKKKEIPPREQDFRCWPLKEPEVVKPKEIDLSDFQFDASAIENLDDE